MSLLATLRREAETRPPPQDLQHYLTLSSHSDKVRFFLFLLCAHPQGDTLFNLVAEASAINSLESHPLINAIWAYSLQLSPQSTEAQQLLALVGQLFGRNFLERADLLKGLPQWVSQGAGLLDTTAIQKKTKRLYTKINYEQSKHSLLKESNEGYSKVILLLTGLKDRQDNQSIWKKVLELVGNFDLDPDRVLDLIVDARLMSNNDSHFIPLLRQFNKNSVTLVIGNRLKQGQSSATEPLAQQLLYCGPPEIFETIDMNQLFREVPFLHNPKLISLTARCIKEGLLSVQSITVYLDPSESTLRKISGKRSELAISKVNKSFTLSMVEIDDAEALRILNEENLQFEGQLLYSSRLSLLAQLVRVNAWTDFIQMWTPLKSKFDLLIYQPLLQALLDLLEWAIQPMLASASPLRKHFRVQKRERSFIHEGNSKEFQQIEDHSLSSLGRLGEIMALIGRYLGFRTTAYLKVCRIFKAIVKEQEEDSQKTRRVKGLILSQLVPANSYSQANGPIALELYGLLELFDYRFRYECYLLVYKETMTGSPFAARIFESVKRRQNIIVNNLSKENKKVFGRRIAKLMHNQALPVLYWIIRRVVMEDYEAVVPEIVSALASSTSLTLDMTIFVMLWALNEHKEGPVNIKTHEFQPWFKNIITFISNFFRKYLDADIQPVFDHILLKTGLPFEELEQQDQLPGALLKLLHELLNKMHGSVMLQEVNKSKLDAIAAGPKLQAELLQLSSEVKAAKKSKVMLQKFFWGQNKDHQSGLSLAFNLLVLLSQKRAEVLTKAVIDNLKVVADIYDDFTLLLVQLVRVLLYQAQDHIHYALLLPQNPMQVLLKDYKVPLELACEVARPGVKHIAAMAQEQWEALVSSFTSCYSECLQDSQYLKKSYRSSQKVEEYLSAYKERIMEILPGSFFTSFWFLTIDSVYFPTKSYQDKIDDLKKKMEQQTSRRNEKQSERTRLLLQKLSREEQIQRKKYEDTGSQENMRRLEVECLKSTGKEKEKKQNSMIMFAEAYVQICLLPRMMLDRAQALYCVKFTTALIRANKMTATKSIRLVFFIIEYVMNYLPFTTHRQANTCLSVFLSQILTIFINWNDPLKLKQDLKRTLGVEDPPGKDNYPKLRDYLLRPFERVGNIIMSIKEEPYIIKNCLYLLEKVDSIPGYKQQADDLMRHLTQLKQLYSTAVDMRTILDRQIAMLSVKKNDLPQKPEEKKNLSFAGNQVEGASKNQLADNGNSEKKEEREKKQSDKEKEKSQQAQAENPTAKGKSGKSPFTQNNQLPIKPVVFDAPSTRAQFNPLKGDKILEQKKAKLQKSKQQGAVLLQAGKDEQRRRQQQEKHQRKAKQVESTRRVDTQQERSHGEKHVGPKILDRNSQEKREDAYKIRKDQAAVKLQINKELSSIPPPKRLSEVKQELKQQGQTGGQQKEAPHISQNEVDLNFQKEALLSAQKDISQKHKQQELSNQAHDNASKNQKRPSSAREDPFKHPANSNPSIGPSKSILREDSGKMQIDPLRGPQENKDQRESREDRKEREKNRQGSQQKERKDHWKDNKKWENKKAYYSRDPKSEPRQDRRDERRDKQKDKERKHDKYRSRSREKYNRR